MFGGSPAAAREIEPFARILAPTTDSGWLHCGPSGSGHFVKMIHNGIEYGMMQAIAEGVALLKGKEDFELGRRRDYRDVAARQRGALVAARPYRGISARGSGLADIAPIVADSGEGAGPPSRPIEAGRSGTGTVTGADHALCEPG